MLVNKQLTLADSTHNALTFGIGRAGFRSGSSDGFGKEQQSWGIYEDRRYCAACSTAATACSTAALCLLNGF